MYCDLQIGLICDLDTIQTSHFKHNVDTGNYGNITVLRKHYYINAIFEPRFNNDPENKYNSNILKFTFFVQLAEIRTFI